LSRVSCEGNPPPPPGRACRLTVTGGWHHRLMSGGPPGLGRRESGEGSSATGSCLAEWEEKASRRELAPSAHVWRPSGPRAWGKIGRTWIRVGTTLMLLRPLAVSMGKPGWIWILGGGEWRDDDGLCHPSEVDCFFCTGDRWLAPPAHVWRPSGPQHGRRPHVDLEKLARA
jgi:hypothetical protein